MIRTSKEHLNVFYDGPALACHEMDVRVLAPALYAFSDLLKSANQALNGDRAEMEVRVRASFKSGSFGIELHTLMSLLEASKAFFGNEDVKTAKEILEWLGLLSEIGAGAVGLFGMLTWLKGRSPSKIEKISEKESEVWLDNDKVSVPNEIVLLLKDKKVRKAMRDICHPLNEQGIDELALYDNSSKQRKTLVRKEDLHCFDVPNQDELVTEDETVTTVQITRVDFTAKKWGFSDGNTRFSALVLDDRFFNLVRAGEVSFSNGNNFYKVRLCRKLFSRDGVDISKVEYSVLEFLDRVCLASKNSFKSEQGVLPFDES